MSELKDQVPNFGTPQESLHRFGMVAESALLENLARLAQNRVGAEA